MMRNNLMTILAVVMAALCLGATEVQAINVKERTDTKSDLNHQSQKQINGATDDSTLIQTNQPALTQHLKEQSMMLAQMTSMAEAGKIKLGETDTGMVILITVVVIILVIVLICCCCYCCACCLIAAQKAEEQKKMEEMEKKEKEDKDKMMDAMMMDPPME